AAILVAGDRPRADIDVAPEDRVAHVAEMIDLAAHANAACLDFDEIADVNLVGKNRRRPYARIRPNAAFCTNRGIFDKRERSDRGAVTDEYIPKHTVGADPDVVSELDFAFEDAVDVDHNIAAAVDR